MVKREKKRKLGGSVLLTVVCVMSLLIIFLFGTLALATAANNRAHVNYSTAQTDVTSRTVVDAAIKAMEANTDFGNAVSNLNTVGGSSGFEVNVQLGDGTEGRYGHIKPVQVKYVGTKKFYDTDKKEWVDGDIIQFLSKVNMAGVESSTAAYIVKQPPEVSIKSNTGGGAGFVTTAGANLTCSTNLFGGTYINLPRLEDAEKYKYQYYKITVDPASNAITSEDRTTDREYSNWGTDKSIYRQFTPYNSTADAFFLDNSNAVAEADIYVNNNMYVDDWSGFIFPGEGKGITIWGDLVYGNGNQSYTFNLTTDETTEIDFNKIPYIYVDGEIAQGSNTDIKIGSDGFPLNIFCGSIDTNKTNNANVSLIAGDIYCMNPLKTSKIGGQNPSHLYNWAASVVTKTEGIYAHKTSSIYSKGNLELTNVIVDGDVRVEGNCTIKNNVTINGNLVVGGKLKIESGAKLNLGTDSKIYCDASIAEGLNDGVVQESKYVEVPTILHNVSENPNAEKVENKHRYYLEYKAQPTGGDPTKCYGLLGEPESYFTNEVVYYYKWKENFDPETLFGTNDYAIYGNPDTFTAKGLNIADYIEPGYTNDAWNDRRPANPVDGSVDYYYVKTAWDETAGGYVTKSEPTDKASYYVDKNTHEIVEDFRTVPNMDGSDKGIDKTMAAYVEWNPSYGYTKDSESVWYSKETGSIVSISEATPGALVTYPVESFGDIYPKYAERDVIIGETTLPGIDKAETQIVKTMEDVLTNVADPYKDGQLSLDLSNQYNTLKNAIKDETTKGNVYFESLDAISAKNGKYAQVDGNTGLYTVVNSAPTGKLQQNEGVIINTDCILNMQNLRAAENGGYIIFEPGTRDMLVVVYNLQTENMKIIVNDKQGGNVNFLLEKSGSAPGKMKLSSSENWIATTSYLEAFANNSSDAMSYNSDIGLKLETLGKPHINIFGSADTEFESTESGGFIANVISPDLKFTLKAGTKMTPASGINKIYYNNNELSQSNAPFVIGCINSSFADIPNMMNVIYVTDSEEGSGGSAGGGESAFNYRVLYYDEY